MTLYYIIVVQAVVSFVQGVLYIEDSNTKNP